MFFRWQPEAECADTDFREYVPEMGVSTMATATRKNVVKKSVSKKVKHGNGASASGGGGKTGHQAHDGTWQKNGC